MLSLEKQYQRECWNLYTNSDFAYLKEEAVSHFTDLYKATSPQSPKVEPIIMEHTLESISHEDNDVWTKKPTKEKIHQVLFSFNLDKELRLGWFTTHFYQQFCEVIKYCFF